MVLAGLTRTSIVVPSLISPKGEPLSVTSVAFPVGCWITVYEKGAVSSSPSEEVATSVGRSTVSSDIGASIHVKCEMWQERKDPQSSGRYDTTRAGLSTSDGTSDPIRGEGM